MRYVLALTLLIAPAMAFGADSDSDGFDDDEEGTVDSDLDTVPDYLDDDSDDDTVLDIDEAHGNTDELEPFGDVDDDRIDADDDGDGLPTIDEASEADYDVDGIDAWVDPDDDDDGVDTTWELQAEFVHAAGEYGEGWYKQDTDSDGVRDDIEWGSDLATSNPRDSDVDGIIDAFDSDDDGDGLQTAIEGQDDRDGDENCLAVGDGIPNYLDLDSDVLAGRPVCVIGELGGTDAEEGDEDFDADGVPDFRDCDQCWVELDDSDPDLDGLGTTAELAVCVAPEQDACPLGFDWDGACCLNPGDPDTDEDGTSDGVELPRGDTDADGIIDPFDADDDGDGVLHEGDETHDLDADGTPDSIDADDNGDGVPTLDQTDDDSDCDRVSDAFEVGADAQDGPCGDADADGLTNEDEEDAGLDPNSGDSDGDGRDDADELGDGGFPMDTDLDGLIDALDTDDDGDGIPSAEEGWDDLDEDTFPNARDTDADGDGILDANESGDADGNGVPDWSEVAPEPDTDVPDTDVADTDADDEKSCSSVGGAGMSMMAAIAVLGLIRRRRVA